MFFCCCCCCCCKVATSIDLNGSPKLNIRWQSRNSQLQCDCFVMALVTFYWRETHKTCKSITITPTDLYLKHIFMFHILVSSATRGKKKLCDSEIERKKKLSKLYNTFFLVGWTFFHVLFQFDACIWLVFRFMRFNSNIGSEWRLNRHGFSFCDYIVIIKSL